MDPLQNVIEMNASLQNILDLPKNSLIDFDVHGYFSVQKSC